MKKMKFMRIAAVMLILCLASTCAISGTFAKYTTSGTATDNARVAIWGFGSVADMEITDLFQMSYSEDNGMSAAADAIAPGTKNSTAFKFVAADAATAPEVAYQIAVDVTGCTISNDLKANTAITWWLDDDSKALTWDELMTALKGLSGDATDGIKEYAANTDIPSSMNSEHTIGWNWAFETTDNGTDAADTDLGNDAVNNTVTISIVITATQLDKLA